MCTLCQNFQPWAEPCPHEETADINFAATESGGAESAELPVFTYDQIADQLTTGYWGASGPRSFDVSAGGTLYVDITGLTASGQAMARAALDAWSQVTGLNFVEVAGTPPPATVFSEVADAASGTATAYTMSVGDDFIGTLATGADRDAVAVFLTLGQTVDIKLSGEGSSPTGDPYLRLLNSAGSVVAQSDDAIGKNSAITFQAAYTGWHHVQASSFDDSFPGDYRISVREPSLNADIVFDDANPGAYAGSSILGGTIQSSFVNIAPNWAGGENRIDGYYFQTYLHEVGHALGLGHAGNYNGSATYGVDNLYDNDSWQASVMSYFHQTENTLVDASFAYVITPQIADILAIQALYGTPPSSTGDTIYGDGGNSGTHLDAAQSLTNPVTFTVFDTAGTDTFDFSSYSAHQVLDLREKAHSDLAGLDGNVGIARGTVIEHGLTGSGNDLLTGNTAGNGLSAGAGADTVRGGAGNDAIRGQAGADDLAGEAGFDLIEGGTGNNLIQGGTGGDLLIGDDVTLDMLTMIYPAWTPPANAQQLLDAGELWVIWDDILTDLAIV